VSWPDLGAFLLILLWNAIVLGVTTYLVFWMGHSGWWYLLALILIGNATSSGSRN
jgi:hypothetical protein